MNTWKWVVGYALALVGAGALLTYQLYFGSEQVRVRAEQCLAGILRIPSELEGCEADWGAMTISSVIAGSDARISPNAFLEAFDVRARMVHRSQSRPAAGLGRGASETEEGGGAPESDSLLQVEISRGRLCVLHDLTGTPQAGSWGADSWGGSWDFERVLNLTAAAQMLSQVPARIYVDQGVVDIVERRRDGTRVWPVRVGRCRIEAMGSDGHDGNAGIAVRGQILPGPNHSSGEFSLQWTPDGRVEASGIIKGLRLPDAAPPLMPRIWVAEASELAAHGVVDYVVEEAVWVPGGAGSVRGRIRHDASRLRLRGGVLVRAVEGVVEAASHKLTYGTRAEPLSGEILGAPVKIYGSITERGQTWHVDVKPIEIAKLFVPVSNASGGGDSGREVNRRWRRCVDALRPHGTVTGHADVQEATADRWRGRLSWSECRFRAWPWLGGGTVEVTWEEIEPGAVKGTVALRDVRVDGAGRLHGEVDVRLAGADLEAQFTQLSVKRTGGNGAPRPGAERDSANVSNAPEGAAFGRLRWNLSEGLKELTVRWLDLTLAGARLRVRGVRGEVSCADPERAVTGRVECAAAAVAAGVFGDQPLVLGHGGGGTFRLHSDRVELRSLRLLGSRQALRARGELRYSGEVNLTVVIGSASALRFRSSELNARPLADWYDAAGPAVRAYRVTTREGRWDVRAISAGDPSLARPSR